MVLNCIICIKFNFTYSINKVQNFTKEVTKGIGVVHVKCFHQVLDQSILKLNIQIFSKNHLRLSPVRFCSVLISIRKSNQTNKWLTKRANRLDTKDINSALLNGWHIH